MPFKERGRVFQVPFCKFLVDVQARIVHCVLLWALLYHAVLLGDMREALKAKNGKDSLYPESLSHNGEEQVAEKRVLGWRVLLGWIGNISLIWGHVRFLVVLLTCKFRQWPLYNFTIMADCKSAQNIWTSCLLVEPWVVSVTMQYMCLNPFFFYNIH